MYTKYTCNESWYEYQRYIPSHLHSKSHYHTWCQERALLYDNNMMVLMDNVVKVGDWSWISGWSAQHHAEKDGYIDVRTGKKYSSIQSIFVDIGK